MTQPPLHEAAARGDLIAIAKLIDDGVKINEGDYIGYTALHVASGYGHDAAVSYLINCGADVNATSKAGWTSLHRAAMNGRVKSVQILAEHGADIFVRTRRNESAIEIAKSRSHLNVVAVLQKLTNSSNSPKKHERRSPIKQLESVHVAVTLEVTGSPSVPVRLSLAVETHIIAPPSLTSPTEGSMQLNLPRRSPQPVDSIVTPRRVAGTGTAGVSRTGVVGTSPATSSATKPSPLSFKKDELRLPLDQLKPAIPKSAEPSPRRSRPPTAPDSALSDSLSSGPVTPRRQSLSQGSPRRSNVASPRRESAALASAQRTISMLQKQLDAVRTELANEKEMNMRLSAEVTTLARALKGVEGIAADIMEVTSPSAKSSPMKEEGKTYVPRPAPRRPSTASATVTTTAIATTKKDPPPPPPPRKLVPQTARGTSERTPVKRQVSEPPMRPTATFSSLISSPSSTTTTITTTTATATIGSSVAPPTTTTTTNSQTGVGMMTMTIQTPESKEAKVLKEPVPIKDSLMSPRNIKTAPSVSIPSQTMTPNRQRPSSHVTTPQSPSVTVSSLARNLTKVSTGYVLSPKSGPTTPRGSNPASRNVTPKKQSAVVTSVASTEKSSVTAGTKPTPPKLQMTKPIIPKLPLSMLPPPPLLDSAVSPRDSNLLATGQMVALLSPRAMKATPTTALPQFVAPSKQSGTASPRLPESVSLSPRLAVASPLKTNEPGNLTGPLMPRFAEIAATVAPRASNVYPG